MCKSPTTPYNLRSNINKSINNSMMKVSSTIKI